MNNPLPFILLQLIYSTSTSSGFFSFTPLCLGAATEQAGAASWAVLAGQLVLLSNLLNGP